MKKLIETTAGGSRLQWELELGESLKDLVDKWGEECVYSYAANGLAKSARDCLYNLTNGPRALPPSEALKAMETWEPPVSRLKGENPVASFLRELKRRPTPEGMAKLKEYLNKKEETT